MSLFPRFAQEFTPLFRLLDDYDRASRDTFPQANRHLRSFTPKFDVKELKDAYELHGELPGIDQKDISLEWSDSNTLTISGHVESHYESGEPPRGTIEDVEKSDNPDYKKPTVEEEGEASNTTSQALTKTDDTSKELSKPAEKFWVMERSVGEFHRSFSFPARVDQDNVKASLKNGVLTIAVPKAQKPQARRININVD
jgi:HSP20 family molecular chaperone IbpA